MSGGINYHINNTALATIEYANITNYDFDKEHALGAQASENRIWQQHFMRNNIGRFLFDHRYRIKQRWIRSNNSIRYLDRIRYMLRLAVPLNKKLIEKNAVILSFYDEVFIHISKTQFDRNRIFGSIGYQFLPDANIQMGYFRQTVNIQT